MSIFIYIFLAPILCEGLVNGVGRLSSTPLTRRLRMTEYEPQFQPVQGILALSILGSFALIQARVNAANGMGVTLTEAQDKLRRMKARQLDGNAMPSDVQRCIDDLNQLEDKAIRLKTFVDVPGGPKLLLRVADRTVRALGSEASEEDEDSGSGAGGVHE